VTVSTPMSQIVEPRRLVAVGTSLVIGFAATGGEILQTVLLATPIALVFLVAGYVGGLLAFCGALSGVTGIYALLNLLRYGSPIPTMATYLLVSFVGLVVALLWRKSSVAGTDTALDRFSPIHELVPLLIAVISGYVVFQWAKSTDLEFLNSLGGSEDNAAWISGTRTFIAGEMTTDFLAHPTAKSPVTGTTLGFVSDVYWVARSNVPEHLLAIRALRTAYALIISLTAVTAGVWVSVVAHQAKVNQWLSAVASTTIGMAMLGSSLFLFTGIGFFSFINGVLFCLVVALGCEVAFSHHGLTRGAESVLLLVVSGMAGAWWGVAPVAAVLVALVVTSAGFRQRWTSKSIRDVVPHVVVNCLAVATLLWTWHMSMGTGIEIGHVGSTGTVPIVGTSWFPLILLAVAVLTSRSRPFNAGASFRKRMLFPVIAVYAAAVWLTSMFEYAEPRYAAFKILVLLSLLSMAGFGAVLVESLARLGRESLVVGLALVLLWSSAVHESHNGFRGPGLSASTATSQAKILDVLEDSPEKQVVCLHQDPSQVIPAYLCSRLSAAFSPGRSRALAEWTGALLNSDISPNGVLIPKEEHVGSRVLSRLRSDVPNLNLVVILIGGDETQGVVTDLGPDFWWVQELNWSEIQVAHL
jgi:hypothetical protein